MRTSRRGPRRSAIVTVSLALGLTCVLAGIAFASGALGQNDSLSKQGQGVQASYAALDQALADWEASKQAAAASDAPLDPQASRPSFTPDPWPDTLRGGEGADFLDPARFGFTFVSSWTHAESGSYWAVYSGSSEDSKFGILLIQKINPQTMSSTFLRVDTDVEGSLKIADSKGMTLFVTSVPGGKDLTFDISLLSSEGSSGAADVTKVTELVL